MGATGRVNRQELEFNRVLSRIEFIQWLRTKVPARNWSQVWWLSSLSMVLMLPIASPVLLLLGLLGWNGAPFAMQGLMLASVLGGVAIGSVVLLCIEAAGLPAKEVHRAKWLARLALIGPVLELLVAFWLAGRSR